MKKLIIIVLLLLIATTLQGQQCHYDYLRFKKQYPKLTISLYNRVVLECREHDIYNKIKRVNKPYDIAVRTMLAICHAESCFNPKAKGLAGEYSYWQLMWYNLPKYYVTPLDSTHYAVKHFAGLLDKWKGSTVRAVNSYNRGVNKKHDIDYVGKILDNIER